MCRRYRKHGEKVRAFATVTGRGGLSVITVQGSTAGIGETKGSIIRTPRALGDPVRSTDNRWMKTDSMSRGMAGRKWDRAMEVDWNGYFKAARPVAPAIRGRNYDKNIHVTSANDVRGDFGRSNDFTSKVENIGCIKALPMDRRVLMSEGLPRRRGVPVAVPPSARWIGRKGVGAGLMVSIGQ